MNKQEIKNIIKPILLKNGVLKASLFGSVARGDENISSDLDIIVQFEEKRTLLDLIGLKYELEEMLNKKVDILTYDSINTKIKENILNDKELIYG